MKKMQFIMRFIEKICITVSIISLFAIMCLTTFDVLARKIFDYSIPSLYEFTSDYLMVALVYLTMSYVYVNDGHIRVTMFVDKIPKGIKPILDKLLDLSAVVLFVSIAIVGWNSAVRSFQFNEVSSSILAYPLGPALLFVPIGAGLMAIRIIQSIFFPKTVIRYRDTLKDTEVSA